MKGHVVPFDAASALWQFAAKHAWEYLRGNHTPALIEWAHFLNYLRSICRWDLRVYMDGMENVEKRPEIERRNAAVAEAEVHNSLIGQIRNTPDYIAKAVNVCKFLGIEVYVSAYEADPQVSFVSLSNGLIAVTGDSDLLAYGVARKLILVKGFLHEWYRVIDLDANTTAGEYPLLDLYENHGKVVFQLYAGCRGCDFTNTRSGIQGLGFKKFIALAVKVEGGFTPKSLAAVLWEYENDIASKNGFESADDVENYLQRIVDVYSKGQVYDKESNIINMSISSGSSISKATTLSEKHMAGEVNSQTKEQHPDILANEVKNMDCS